MIVLGSYVANRITNKIEQIDDRIFMCRSGSAADTQKIGNIIRQNLDFFKYICCPLFIIELHMG